MGYKRYGRYGVLLLALGIVLYGGSTVMATTLKSDNYQVVESEFGSGSGLESCSGSGNYCARTAIGSLTIGDSSAGSKRVEFGPITEDEPALEVIVEQNESDLGELTTETTAKTSVLVKVRNYLSNGYVMQMTGDAPKISNHTLTTPLTPTASTQGTEQFGINAVANTTPTVGANAVQVPSGDFSFGVVDSEYSTANLFKYESGDTVARSPSESGQTNYTISMIVNVSNTTPAGRYAGDFSIVVIPVY